MQMKVLKLCGGGCSHPSKMKPTRDAVCRAFTQLYDENPSDFPVECRDAPYLDRLRRAYPIHPELFDRLYDDWSPLDNFQKTRGVLRLMAAVIHHLWINEDRAPLILPGSIPLDSPRVREELLRYLPESWNAVVDKDVDGDRSEPRAVDEGNTHVLVKSLRRAGWHAQSSWEARHMEVGKPCAVLKKCEFASVLRSLMSICLLCSTMQPNV